MEQLTFGWIDYLIFACLLGVSVMIGIYFAFFSKQNSVNEYVYGGKSMSFVPVAVSGVSSLLSAITFLGYPTEVYLHGTQYYIVILTATISILITNYIFLPVFFKLQLVCVTEYLELRFSKAVRKLCSITYAITLTMFCAVVIYAPALAFTQLTGADLHLFTPVLCAICIFYTSIGGIKAVIWTDTFQFMFTLVGIMSIFVIGIIEGGGLLNIMKVANKGQRLVLLNMNPSIYERCSFWSVLSYLTFTTLGSLSVSQKFVQKLLSVHEEKEARKAVWAILYGSVFFKYVCIILGLAMYAKYQSCDPLKAKLIERMDQLLPYFVMESAGHISGLPGVFLAGIIGSALATLSAALNTLGSVIYDDFLRPWLPEKYTEESKAPNIIKATIVLIGLTSIGLIFVAERLGTIFEIASSLASVVSGPILGLFFMGMVLPWVGKGGALVGGYSSFVFMLWIFAGTKWHVMNRRIRYEHLPTTVEGCGWPSNGSLLLAGAGTTVAPPLPPEDEPMAIFRISILHYSLIGTALSVLVGIVASYVAGELDAGNVDPDLITPVMHRFLPKKIYTEVPLENFNNNIKRTASK